ncbi:hypothetical protein N7462_010343 [Penicillium macrosclerotiorum]|uniref:uncharacterized protein n=1 Tax=Penicillium macrosclerotiorum TaxID=303699 RepID=UPI002548DCE8|nr:uncharacterized protein N7462_010343 [Penicillium macrosclerotiorum]KAJ5669273.1 hypothetical protein N7462_010343 [Penicillium macrosclerotiorum]
MELEIVLNGLLLVLSTLLSILKQLFSYGLLLLYLLASPVLYLGRNLLSLALLPLRILIKFEAFLTFVTGAVLTGVTVGLFLYITGDTLSQFLRLQQESQLISPDGSIDLKDPSLEWEAKLESPFLPSTILEEEESSQ